MNMNTPHSTHPTKADRTNASAATTKRSRAASFGRLWMIGWLVVAIALVAVSLRKSGEAPEQIASSESAIQDAANLDRALTPVSFETAEKKLRSKLIHTFQPIEALRVGDRVIADNPDTETPEATAVDPKTWRLVKLYAEERWPDGTLDTIHIESLQPPVWFELLGAEVGSEVPPPLDLVEMGLPEELRTKVTAIEPCPPIQIGNGRVVLTTVNHLNNDVWELAAVNSAGKLEKLHPTGLHKFYSETRGDWVSTKQIHDNEVIRGRAGPLTIVDSRPLEGTQRVYNLTVEGEHVYYVSELGLLAHNNWCGGRNIDVYHTVGGEDLAQSVSIAQSVLDGINPKFLNPESRFGAAFYTSDDVLTTIAERAHHGATSDFTIRFSLNSSKARILDLSSPTIASRYGYAGGPINSATKGIGKTALEQGYNVIKVPSLRGQGMNYAVLGDFDQLLSPQAIVRSQ